MGAFSLIVVIKLLNRTPMVKDRFSKIKNDPRFKEKKLLKESKDFTKIDDRFADVLKNEDFKSKQKFQLKSETAHESETDESENETEGRKVVSGVYDPARGIGVESSSDEESESEIESDSEETSIKSLLHNWNFNDDNVTKSEDANSSVLTMCNFDANEISAEDIYMLLQSFLPLNGSVKCVKVFISDYGKEKLAEEATEGPKALKVENYNSNNLETNMSEKEATEKVRVYQAQRLRYYYAIINCNDAETAAHLYEVCDGLEFESSATFVDLRFVPENERFEDKTLKEEYYPSITIKKYKPNSYTNKALSHQKADLTWESDDRKRKEVLKKRVIDEETLDDYNAFLASSSSEDESENEEPNNAEEKLAKRRALLLGDVDTNIPPSDQNSKTKSLSKQAEANEKSITIQLSQEETVKLKNKKAGDNSDSDSSEVSEAESDSDNSDVEFDIKRDQTKSQAQAEKPNDLSLLLADVEDSDRKHFDYNKIIKNEKMSDKSRKRKNVKEIDSFHVDTNDSRFTALFENPEFAIDPSDPKFKATYAMKEVVSKRAQFRAKKSRLSNQPKPETQSENIERTSVAISNEKAEQSKPKLSALVESLKMKTALHKKNLKKK